MPESHVPTVVMSDLADWQKTAIEAFVSQCTLPILYDEESHLDQIGTGTLIEIEERLFLITADHLLEGRDPARFSIPMPPAKIPWTLGGCKLLRPKMQTGDIDVGIFELLEDKTIRAAKISWKILSLDHIGEASQNGVFVLCGYPTAVAKVHNGNIAGKLISAYTQRLCCTPPWIDDAVDGLDLFFNYDKTAIGFDGREVQTPELQGASGGCIWEVWDIPPTQVWSPERCMKIVGFQSSYTKGECFRAKNALILIEMFRREGVLPGSSVGHAEDDDHKSET